MHLYLPWPHCPALTLELRDSWRSFWRSQGEGSCSLCLQMSGQILASERAKKLTTSLDPNPQSLYILFPLTECGVATATAPPNTGSIS